MSHRVAIIGLGMMGRRMASNMAAHPEFVPYVGWDPEPAACSQAKEDLSGMRIGGSARDVIDDVQTDLVYVASPPLMHEPHVAVAIEAGKAVFCEKPLGVDIAQSCALVEALEECGLSNAINFPFAACPAVGFIDERLEAGAAGQIVGADILLHFSQWPRPAQMGAASWLAKRPQGGFVREVLTHFVFLIERLLGPAKLEYAQVRYPERDGSEERLIASLNCHGIPVSVAGSVGGVGPDRVEFTLWGKDQSYCLHDWYWVKSSDGDEWKSELAQITDPRKATYAGTLDSIDALLRGNSSTAASFREALSVQILIETILEA